jgi:sialic acid synthase SpsE
MTSRPTITLPNGFQIGGPRTFVIAEIGSNHAGNLDTALQSIDAAASTGADAVKFQSIDLEALYHNPTGATCALHRKIDLPEAWHAPLKQRCDERGLVFFSSPTYIRAIDVLESVGVSLYKLASAQIAVFPQLVQRVAELGRPVILSTGLVTMEEIARVVQIFRAANNHQFVILHCNSVYPAGPDIVHLPRMLDYQRHFNCHVGFSDHSETNTASIAAVAMGASVIERHFTLSRELDSPDAPLSLEPREFTHFVQAVREAEMICKPSPRDALEPDEQAFKTRIRHCLLSSKEIVEGTILDDSNTLLMRGGPINGIDAWQVCRSSGKLLAKKYIAKGRWVQADDIA